MGCRVSDYGPRGGVTLLATKTNDAEFSTTETWYTDLEKYDLIVLNCNAYNPSFGFGGLSGCFIPSMLKAVLNNSGFVRVLLSNKYSNNELACILNKQDKFTTYGGTLYIYGIKLGSTLP